MQRALILTSILLSAAPVLRAHTPFSTKITWSRDISRIMFRNCASCHHPGGSSFSLITFKEARPWAEDLKLQVLERRMPPWNAVKGFGEFKNDRGLTQEDLEIIAEWVDGGAPEGNALYMPLAPDFKTQAPDAPRHERSHERSILLQGSRSLLRPLKVIGIRVEQVPASGLQVVARRPSGAMNPMIWLEKFNSSYNQTYYFRRPLRLPKGTRIEIVPPQGSIALVLQ